MSTFKALLTLIISVCVFTYTHNTQAQNLIAMTPTTPTQRIRMVYPVHTPAVTVLPVVRTPIAATAWTESAKVWLARSCIGEAGFHSPDECIAIAWVYATRTMQKQVDFTYMVQQYSAPLKRLKNRVHKRVWIFHLNAEGTRPRHWPKHLRWKPYREKWIALLNTLDSWAQGHKPNPLPGANHFGSRTDKPGTYWVRLKTPDGFRNRFYRAKQKQ